MFWTMKWQWDYLEAGPDACKLIAMGCGVSPVQATQAIGKETHRDIDDSWHTRLRLPDTVGGNKSLK